MKRLSLSFLSVVLGTIALNAQKLSVSTNFADWGWFVTPNAAVRYGLSRHLTVDAAAKYNDWDWNDGEGRNRQARQEYFAGVRYWPWYIYSGWWGSAGLRYREYSVRPFGDLHSKEEGDAFGFSLSGGYSLSLSKHFNIDFGIGLWAGRKYYRTYIGTEPCPECGTRTDKPNGGESPSEAYFLLPDELTLAAVFVF